MKKYYLLLAFFVFGYSTNIDYSGYTNLYGINRISNGSVIKLPFRLFSYDFSVNYENFSIHTKWGVEHKIKSFNSNQPLNHLMYDLISSHNVDYKADFREYYFSYFPSFGEIKLGKQIHAWGAVDIGSPIDILNPIDYYYLFTDADETKIGRESLTMDLYFDPIKIGLIFMPNHIPNNIPTSDPEFPIALPTTIENYQIFEIEDAIEYGGYIQSSFNTMDWTAYYFSGYDRNFNLHGSSVFQNETNSDSVIDTIFSYRQTEMLGLSNVTFLGGLTLRSDFAYFQTNADNSSIENRPYAGTDILVQFGLETYPNYLTSKYFNIGAEYYQYSIQLEYELPYEIELTTQLFGYEEIEIRGDSIQVSIPDFEISLDSKDFFYPGMGSSMATLAQNALLLNLNKSIWDDTFKFQLSNLLDIKDSGNLTQFKITYNIIENLELSLLYYKGRGNRDKYPDITFIDVDNDGENDDFLNNQNGFPANNGDGIPDADIFDESLLYPFNAMDNFSHIRIQLQYFF